MTPVSQDVHHPSTTHLRRARQYGEILRVGMLVIFFLVSLLVVVPAPTTLAWMLAIVATEWGYLIAGGAAILLIIPWQTRGRRRSAGRIIGIATIVLSLIPIVLAYPILHTLNDRLSNAFGSAVVPEARYTVRHDTIAFTTSDGSGTSLGIDFYRPHIGTLVPCVIVIHGGAWSGGDRQDLEPLNSYLAERGYAVATVSYRLAPRYQFPTESHDVHDAVVYLHQHAATLGFDASRMILLGRSAGGQLALLEAYTNGTPSIRGVVGLYAPADLRYGYTHPSNPHVLNSQTTLEHYLGGSPAVAGAQYDAASPIHFVGAHTVPTLLIHGRRDELVSVAQSDHLSAALLTAGRQQLYLRLPWATHGCDYNFNGPCGAVTKRAVAGFIAAVSR